MSNLPINSPLKGPGLTKPGVVILQFLIIFLFEAVEILFRNSLGIITCLAIFWRNLFRPARNCLCDSGSATSIAIDFLNYFDANSWQWLICANCITY
jgi:hypothetical protein